MAVLDLLSIAEARAAINSHDVTHDVAIAAMVSGISAQVDDWCGPVVARAVTERHDGGSWWVPLRTTPILTVTTVTEYTSAGTPTVLTVEDEDTKPAAGYLLESRGHFAQLLRRSSGTSANFATGRQNVVVVTSAGRYASTETVGEKFKAAVRSMLKVTWDQESPRWAQSAEFVTAAEMGIVPSFVSVESMIKRRLGSELPLMAR